MKKILVIDGNSIINRAFYGVRMLTTKSGRFTNAIYGMLGIVHKQMKAVHPDYAAVAFDLKAPTFRHKMYDGYKAGRHPTPPELLSQFADAKECLSLLGIHVLELEGYEADDIQGTVASLAHTAEEPTESYVLSGDRDLLQLIDDKITVLLASNSDTTVYKEAEFVAKYGIAPSQFVDMKALMGDSSDNIPGVRGIGEKTAANLIKAFGSLDAIYESIDSKEISKGVREKLTSDRDNAYLSRTLAKIKTDTPIKETLEDLRYTGPDRQGLRRKLVELELMSFISRFDLDKPDTQEEVHTEAMPEASYTEADASLLRERLGSTFAAELFDGRLHFCNKMEERYVFSGDFSELFDFLKGKSIICYDAKSLIHKLVAHGLGSYDEVRFLDLMLYAYVLNPGAGNAGLESLATSFLGVDIPAGRPCADVMLRLEEPMRRKISEDGMLGILDGLELPLISILAEIEEVGFKIDKEGMLEYADALDDLAESLKENIYFHAGGEFNINSPKQLADVLFVRLGLPCRKKTKSGFSTDAETLEELRPISPIIDEILEYRQVTKLRGTYAAALPEVADENSRIHTDFKQALTATGRLSSADPNLQNIPIKTKMGRQMRKYFIAEEGNTLVDADYSQIELRLLAHISGDYNMCEAFKAGTDIHTKTASAVFGIPEEAVNEEMRKRAKAVNFGIVYGISGFSLSKDIGTTPSEATKYIKSYLMNYPSIDIYLDEVVKEATERGYTATPMGRRRYIPELSSANGNLRAFGKRVAMNAPIQGAAADIMKLAMIKVHQVLKEKLPEAKIVMQVHDELVIEVREQDAELCKSIVKEAMESAYTLSVPLTVEVTSGKSWLDQE
ncbi:MAG: DNA polymerase I [Clostridia bacterium]|nr:DNA polymerase I [Clostridia bacterium]